VCSLACCAATANTCMVSAGHQQSGNNCLGHQGMLYISVTCLLVSHLCDLVSSGAVCVLACCAATAACGECWSLSNQEATKLCLGHQRNVIHQCYMPSVESFVTLASGAVCVLACCAATANTMVSAGHSAVRKQQKLACSIKGM
jgi:hypothetical protein